MPVELEDFGSDNSFFCTGPARAAEDEGEIEKEREAQRVAAYEAGYRSGWDDSAKAAENESRAVSQELARNLRELSFTYFEARGELLEVLNAFTAELLEKLFPALLPEAAAAAVVEEIGALGKEICDGRVQLLVSPDDSEVVRRILTDSELGDVELREEAALASGQARLRAAAAEIAIDAERLTRTLREAIGPTAKLEELAHG